MVKKQHYINLIKKKKKFMSRDHVNVTVKEMNPHVYKSDKQ